MRALLLPALACLLLVGCEVAPLGARCDNDTDCDKNTTAPSALCRSFSNPGTTCSGGDCLCCPTDTAVLTQMLANGAPLANCFRATPIVDGSTDSATDAAADSAADSATDSGVFTCAVTCTLDQFCDTTTGRCRNQRGIGSACTAGTQCQSTYCVGSTGGGSGVCCISACDSAGYSCSANPQQPGLCVPTSTPFDAATPTDSAAPDTATVPDSAPADAAATDASAG